MVNAMHVIDMKMYQMSRYQETSRSLDDYKLGIVHGHVCAIHYVHHTMFAY